MKEVLPDMLLCLPYSQWKCIKHDILIIVILKCSNINVTGQLTKNVKLKFNQYTGKNKYISMMTDC